MTRPLLSLLLIKRLSDAHIINHAILFPTSRKGNEQLKLDKTKGQHMYINIQNLIEAAT